MYILAYISSIQLMVDTEENLPIKVWIYIYNYEKRLGKDFQSSYT